MTGMLRALAVGLLVLGGVECDAGEAVAGVAEEVRAIGRRDFSSGLVMTGLMEFSSPIKVVLAPNDSDVAQRTPSWVSGFANGGSRTIVLFPGRVSSYPDNNLETLVHHEIAHVLVAEAAHGRRVPRWFNEGLATVAAREWGIEDRARYAAAVVGRGPRTTAELDLGFEQGGRRVTRSYALSGAFVRWLLSEWAEHRFFVREALWHTWVPFLTSSGVLWAAITALAVIAIRRRRTKSAKMRERWDAEEEIAEERTLTVPRKPVDFSRTRSLEDVDDDVVN